MTEIRIRRVARTLFASRKFSRVSQHLEAELAFPILLSLSVFESQCERLLAAP
jgi:hypothetical protein